MVASTFGLLASIPGQTMGVGVFSEYLISKTGLNRIELSFSYMVGTILSSLVLPFAGKLLDGIGARMMILATGLGLGASLLFFAQTVTLINSLNPVFSGFLPDSFLAQMIMTLAFMPVSYTHLTLPTTPYV